MFVLPNMGALGHTPAHSTILLSPCDFAAEAKKGQGCPVTCSRAPAPTQ